jgi:hypothetical protein
MLGGLCRAEMAEAADGPDDAVDIDCGRAVEMPAMGSALDAGHSPRACRFREAQSLAVVPLVPLTPLTAPAPLDPLLCVEAADMVDVAEDCDDRELSEEEELVRCALLRGMSIRETSSALIAFRPLAEALGPRHKFGGGATAVICGKGEVAVVVLIFYFVCPFPPLAYLSVSSTWRRLPAIRRMPHDTTATTTKTSGKGAAALS